MDGFVDQLPERQDSTHRKDRSSTTPTTSSSPHMRLTMSREKIHEEVCGNHSGAQSLSHKIIRQRHYWRTMYKDTTQFTKKCDRCQRFAAILKQPPKPLSNMMSLAFHSVGSRTHQSSSTRKRPDKICSGSCRLLY